MTDLVGHVTSALSFSYENITLFEEIEVFCLWRGNVGEFQTKEPLKQPSSHLLHAAEKYKNPSLEGCEIEDAAHPVSS